MSGLVFIILFLVDVERQGPYGYPNHALAVVKELNGLGVQGEVVGVLVVEKMDCVLVKPKTKSIDN